MPQPNTSRTPRDSLRISSVEPPGWEPSEGRIPASGDTVYCTDGPAEVIRVLGRTSDGSRLLELKCVDRPQPFFASSSNVLIRGDDPEPSAFLDPTQAVGAS
jgi:hypothetical protein